jgi:hypothetical protein
MPHQREIEQKQPEVSAPPSWESSPWNPEERTAAQPEREEQLTMALDDQNAHVIELPQR